MMNLRAVGVVKRWDASRRFGFIRAGGADVFLHRDSLVDPNAQVRPGDLVEFVPATSARGPRAVRVRRLPPQCPKCDTRLEGIQCAACGFMLGT